MKVAVSGKGGVGKTTISASLARLLAQSHDKVYAVDADPDACLAAAVGISEETIKEHLPLVELKSVIDEKSAGGGAFFSLNPDVDDVLENYSIVKDNICFLRMGGIKSGGSSCYCRENTFLHAILGTLLLGKRDAVILDMGAGIEHLTRGTASGVDAMLVVVEPSKNSVNTAKLVKQLCNDLGIKKVKVIGNKIRSPKEEDFIRSNFSDEEILGFVAFDDGIWESAMEQGPASSMEGPLFQSMKTIHDRLLREVGE